ESLTAEAAAHVNEPVPSACGRFDRLPCELDPVFERALAKNPAERYETCGELVGCLRNAFDEAAGETRALTPAQPSPPPSAPRRRSSARWPLLLALLVGAAIVGAILAVALNSGGGNRKAQRDRTTTF